MGWNRNKRGEAPLDVEIEMDGFELDRVPQQMLKNGAGYGL
jgi:hypothetical protein